MRKIQILTLVTLVLCFAAFSGFAQTTVRKVDLSREKVAEIIKKMTENEEDFRNALRNYVFTRKALVQEIGLGGQIVGSYRRDSFMTFTDKGQRFEKILFNPMSTLERLRITPEDLDDLGGINPFALSPQQAYLYDFNYLGKETINELDLYVFDVAPKVMPNPKKSDLRLFQGRIWIDDRDLMLVKSKGKAVPDTKDNKFPVVETWRENIDGKYWFPAYSTSDDELVFDSGAVLKLRMRVSYTNYKQGRSTVIILDDDETTPVEESPKDEKSKDTPPPLVEP